MQTRKVSGAQHGQGAVGTKVGTLLVAEKQQDTLHLASHHTWRWDAHWEVVSDRVKKATTKEKGEKAIKH